MRELKEEWEVELKKLYDEDRGGKKIPKIYREGTPQGSPLSPILSTIALENWPYPDGLCIYADDGVYIGEDLKPIHRWLEEVATTGARVALDKTGEVTGPFNFLGYTLDLNKGYIFREGHGYVDLNIANDEDLEKWLKQSKGLYSEQKIREQPRWEWEIKRHSEADYNSISLLDDPKSLWKTILNGSIKLAHKAFKWTPDFGIHDFMKTSSKSWIWLAENVSRSTSRMERRRIKRLKFPDWLDCKWAPTRKKGYIEINPTVDLVPMEMPKTNEFIIMPRAAFLIEHDLTVGNWENNFNYIEEHGITLVEEIIKDPKGLKKMQKSVIESKAYKKPDKVYDTSDMVEVFSN